VSNIAFIDSETLSLADLPACGAYAYARHPSTDASVWGYAFDDEPFNVWSPSWAYGNLESVKGDHVEPTALLDHVFDGGLVVAWNAAFDRHIWNSVMVPKYGWPELKLHQVLCAQAQAEASNLPGSLAKAAEALGTNAKKDPKGKALIKTLSIGMTRELWTVANEVPERMGHFRVYCGRDCEAMRDIWRATRPLMQSEWDDYHVSEEINDRGVAVDAEFAQAAKAYASAESAEINADLSDLTGDPRLTVTAHTRKAKWLFNQLWPDGELQSLVTKPPKKGSEVPRYSCDRPTREAVLDIIQQPEHAELFSTEHAADIVEFIELIEAGNSAAVHKFKAIAGNSFDGRVHGCYAFNGAGQTGRFSSRGVQVHNLIRDPVKKGDPDRALDAIEDVINGESPEFLVQEYGFPVSRLLARLLRPTFMAAEGKTLVWGDWDQIEARVLPWLSNSRGGDEKLALFESGEDVYKHAAAGIFNTGVADIDSGQRQIGKVAELALGFGGSVGAFSAMGRSYGLVLPETQVMEIVSTWRRENRWCVNYWDELWFAAMSAFKNPGAWYHAGRVRYLYHPHLMHGTLICELPCERWLVYPQFRHEQVDVEGENGRTFKRWRTTFVKGFGSGSARVDLWYGILAENITQGAAASMLRLSLSRMSPCDNVVLHTHDEIVSEVPGGDVEMASALLEHSMTELPGWAEGLPLSVSIESGDFYTK